MNIWMLVGLAVAAPFAFLGLAVAVVTTYRVARHLKMKKVRAHPLAMRPGHNSQNAQGLLDEPPEGCAVCGTPMLSIARAPFTPTGATYQLPAVEHFRCENGHTFMGPNQQANLDKRMAIRKGLKDVSVNAPTADRLIVKVLADTNVVDLKAKVQQLSDEAAKRDKGQ